MTYYIHLALLRENNTWYTTDIIIDDEDLNSDTVSAGTVWEAADRKYFNNSNYDHEVVATALIGWHDETEHPDDEDGPDVTPEEIEDMERNP